jgi:enoyl-CoA hydratase
MTYDNLIFRRDDDIVTLSFNRPQSLNAINTATLTDLAAALERIEKDGSIRGVVMTGEGDRAFVAGADIAEMVNLSPLELRAFSVRAHELFFRLEKLPVPVVAAVNGFALGGGAEIALACDFIYASEQARFGQPEVTLGLIPGWGGTQRLARLVGKARAKELCMTGELLSAEEALRMGLVNRVWPAAELMRETLKTVGRIASLGRVSIRSVKHCIDRGFDSDLRTACALEADAFGYCAASPDGREGMTAFLEKRKAEFKGPLV